MSIYSHQHFALSLGVGAAWWAVGPETGLSLPVLLVVAAVVGVGIDFDHFLVQRIRTGGWDSLRYCLRHPTAVFVDQSSIFPEGDVGKLPRLLSHHAVGGPAVLALAFVAPAFAAFVATVLYVHVLADLVADVGDVYGGDGAVDPAVRSDSAE